MVDMLDTLSVDFAALGLGPDEAESVLESIATGRVLGGRGSRTQLGTPEQRYIRLTELGHGGMGRVWRVWDMELNRSVATKVLRPKYAASEAAMARFIEEAQLTAQLQHPGIVPVHEVGRLASGEVFFTMKEVTGETVSAVVRRRHGRGGAGEVWSLRRIVEAIRRVSEALAYAHARGVTHLDLKPSNVMVGSFGEVYVMDWGLARMFAAAPRPSGSAEAVRTDRSVTLPELGVGGTPAYMAPEQARGDAELGPATDVFALGGVLFQVLTGQPPIPGETGTEALAAARQGERRLLAARVPIPEELADICRACLHPEVSARPADAGVVAELLLGWLDGAQKEEQVTELLAEADGVAPEIVALRARAREASQMAGQLLGDLPSHASDAQKRPGWTLQDEADRLTAQAVAAETRWLQILRSALRLLPEHEGSNRRLADYFRERHEAAEQAGLREEAARHEADLRQHDQGWHSSYLQGESWVSVVTEPPGAVVELFEYTLRDRRLQVGRGRVIGGTPLYEHPVPHGSYLAVLTAPGHPPVRYPVFLERGKHWDGTPPGAFGPTPVVLPMAASLGEDDVFVPGGWAWTGGDKEAGEPLPRRRLWIEPFVVRRFPVTNREYLEFLNGLLASGEEDASEWAPRDHLSEEASATLFPRGEDGRFGLGVDADGVALLPEHPVRRVTWFAASRYARWEAERTGQPWRLLNELEWEKAARGVDGRPFVWGPHREAAWANVLGAREGVPRPQPVGAFPLDESPYGVRDLAGNVRDWCGNDWTHDGPTIQGSRLVPEAHPRPRGELRAMRGGAWQSSEMLCRISTRFGNKPGLALGPAGFRLGRGV